MACCFLIVAYVWHEVNYDRFQPHLDRLYRVNYHINLSREIDHARVPPPLGAKLQDYFPEIEAAARMYPRNISVTVSGTEKQFEMEEVYFAFLAILISCFGRFGLAAIATQQRFKEIGIRKVLGASVWQILQIFVTDFLWLIGIAMLLAAPLTWYFADKWMTDFAYRISFPWWLLVLTGLLVAVLAFLTISARTAKTAFSNPVEALKYE